MPEPGRRGEVGPAPSARELDLLGVLAAFRKHIRFIVGVTVIALAFSVYTAFTADPEYIARGLIRIVQADNSLAASLGATVRTPDMGGISAGAPDVILSQLEVLRSRSFAERVVRSTPLRLESQTPEFSPGQLREVSIEDNARPGEAQLTFGPEGYRLRRQGSEVAAVYGEPVSVGAIRLRVDEYPGIERAVLNIVPLGTAIGEYIAGISATPRPKTDVVEIAFTSEDPHLSREVVNTTIAVFEAQSIDFALQELIRRRAFVERQLLETDAELAAARSTLGQFQEREHVFSSQDWFIAQQEGLMDLNMKYEEMAVERGMYATLLEDLRDEGQRGGVETLVSVPGVADNPVISNLYQELVSHESTRDSITMGTWGSAATNPRVERYEGLIESTRQKLIRAIESHIAALDARLAAMQKLRERTLANIQQLPQSGIEEVGLLQEVEGLQGLATHLRTERQRAELAEGIETGSVRVLDWAQLPRESGRFRRNLVIGLGLLLGLLVGTGGALLKEQLSTGVSGEGDLEEVVRVPTLAVIPQMRAPSFRERLALKLPGTERSNGRSSAASSAVNLAVADLSSPTAEAFRVLRANLVLAPGIAAVRTITVTSAVPGEGKTTVAANLAAVFAQAGKQVLLVDGDFRRGRAHSLFDVPRSPGLVDLLRGEKLMDAVVHPTSLPTLHVLAAGNLPRDPSVLLGDDRIEKVLRQLSTRFDLIVIDAPPVLATVDATMLASATDGALLVVRAGATARRDARKAVQKLDQLGARIIGAVLNDRDSAAAEAGLAYYSEYAAHG